MVSGIELVCVLNLAAFFLKEITKYQRGIGISHYRNALITTMLLLMSSLSQKSSFHMHFLSWGKLQINLCMLLKNWSAVTEKIAVTSERGLLVQTTYQRFPYVTGCPFSTETLSFSYRLRGNMSVATWLSWKQFGYRNIILKICTSDLSEVSTEPMAVSI